MPNDGAYHLLASNIGCLPDSNTHYESFKDAMGAAIAYVEAEQSEGTAWGDMIAITGIVALRGDGMFYLETVTCPGMSDCPEGPLFKWRAPADQEPSLGHDNRLLAGFFDADRAVYLCPRCGLERLPSEALADMRQGFEEQYDGEPSDERESCAVCTTPLWEWHNAEIPAFAIIVGFYSPERDIYLCNACQETTPPSRRGTKAVRLPQAIESEAACIECERVLAERVVR